MTTGDNDHDNGSEDAMKTKTKRLSAIPAFLMGLLASVALNASAMAQSDISA
jgi:hypothetical protein